MTVKSDVAQTIYVSGNTWLDQGFPDDCLKTKKKKHYIKTPWEIYYMGFNYGTMELKPYEIKAGESFDMTMEMNWNDAEDAEANKDWSLSIWSSKNPVTITHKGGLKSQAFPLITDGKADPNANANGGNASGGNSTDDKKKDDTKPADPVTPTPVTPVTPVTPTPVTPVEPARPVKTQSQTSFDKLVNDSVPRYGTSDGRCKYDFRSAYKFNSNWKLEVSTIFKTDCVSGSQVKYKVTAVTSDWEKM